VIAGRIPAVEKAHLIINGYGGQKPGYRRVTVDLHVLCQERMVVGVIRIVLSGIVFTDDGIGRKIEKQPDTPIIPVIGKDFWKFIFFHDLSNDQIGSNAQAAAAIGIIPLIGKRDFREILHKVLVGLHQRRIRLGLFANCCPLRNIVFLFGEVFTGIRVFNIGGIAAPVHRNPACIFRNFHQKIVVHMVSFENDILLIPWYHKTRISAIEIPGKTPDFKVFRDPLVRRFLLSRRNHGKFTINP